MHDGFHPHHLHHDHPHAPARGHNHVKGPGQWQMPHLPEGTVAPVSDRERDLDLVEASFVEGFQTCTDPTSFLRLANIPFVGVDGTGERLHLLRVETSISADIGSVSPSFGGGAFLYDPRLCCATRLEAARIPFPDIFSACGRSRACRVK